MNALHPLENASAVLEGFELSPQQARSWRWHQQHFASMPVAELQLHIKQRVDDKRLRKSFEYVVERHEILRTHFRQLAGMALPMQVISPSPNYDWTTSEHAADEESISETVQVIQSALDDGGTRIRLRLPAIHVDALSLPQIALDWWGAYNGENMEEPPVQYADYAAWRNEQDASTGGLNPIWESAQPLDGKSASAVALPLRRARVPLDRIHLVDTSCALPTDLQRRVNTCASALGVDSAVVFLAAWITLCYQHSEAERLTVGIDWQRRSEPLASAVGLFCEPLPLAIGDLDALSFGKLCQHLARECARLDEWRDTYPSAESPEPFALGFRHVMQPDLSALNMAGWHIGRCFSPAAPFQLVLEHRTGYEGESLAWQYNQTQYDHAAIGLLSDQLVSLLENACRHPESQLRNLSACSIKERRVLLEDLNRSLPLSARQQEQYTSIATLPNLAACLSDSFRSQSEQYASRPAVTGPDGMLTYTELDAQSGMLAQYLLSRGIRSEVRIVHFLPRDIDAVTALLAIFKAGACYVPVDPDYPESRINYILNDSQAELILTRSELISRLPAAWQRLALAVDQVPSLPRLFPWPVVEPAHCAYIIYTSGSTGQPKGVVITHANALHSLAARIAYYPDPVQRFLLLSSFAFDSSIAGLFWTLAQGGSLHLCSESQRKDPAQLASIVHENGITHLLALPSLYALLLDELGTAGEAAGTQLNTVIVAGETCPRSVVEAHHRQVPAARLYNEYGPTEAAVWSSVAVCEPEADGRPVPIGRPIPHTLMYVLNERGEPVARGLKGEIHIGGPGLSPGYLGKPELTAEKFIAPAQPGLPSQRLYRTGDFGYIDQDGQLIFIGRIDAQVKIRGYRIELGEIDAALCSVTGAKHAVALADQSQGHAVLRAFVETAQRIDTAVLREQLARQLPDYMIPAEIQAIAVFPRTANGKLDSAALLAFQPARTHQAYVPPRTHVERVLVSIWNELLGSDKVGIQDDFFSLGGHSLLVVKLVHRIKSLLHAQLPVSAVFQHPTIAQLARLIEEPVIHNTLIKLKTGSSLQPPLFCLHRPAGDVQHYMDLVEALDDIHTVYGIQLPETCNPDNAGLVDLASMYLKDIRTAQPQGPYYLCGWSMGGLLALEIAHQLEQAGESVTFLALLDTTFHAEDEPLPFSELIEMVGHELAPQSRDRLNTLRDAQDALQAASEDIGKIDQLSYALLKWAPEYGLTLNAPEELVELNLLAMRNARKWVTPYSPPKVRADLHCWWAEQTLARRPSLPDEWLRFCAGSVYHSCVPGCHEDILSKPGFLSSFNTALCRQDQAHALAEQANEIN